MTDESPTANLHIFQLHLFVAGNTRRSQRAIKNVRSICEAYLADRVDLEVVDIYQQPEMTRRHKVIATPTLVKSQPLPVRFIIGDLSDTPRVLDALGISPNLSHNYGR